MSQVVVAALADELAPLARRLGVAAPERLGQPVQVTLGDRGVWLLVTGEGAARASDHLGELVTAIGVEVVVGIGIAGGLTADLAAGDLVVAERVFDAAGGRHLEPPPSPWLARGLQVDGARRGTAVSVRRIAATPADKHALAGLAESSAVVDLESAAWGGVAERAGLPWVVARCVSDSHDEALPLDFDALRDDHGDVDRGRVLRHALVRPAIWPDLLRLRRRLSAAGERLAGWAVEVLKP